MKNFARLTAFLILTIAFCVSSFAQGKESKDEMFGKIAKLSQSKKDEDRDKAYQMSKDFLAQFGKDDKDDKVVKIKAFNDKYRENAFNKNLDEQKTAEAFAVGKEMLAAEPENSYVTMNLAIAGYDALIKKKDKSFGGDATAYAKQTLTLIEAGKLPKNFQPLANQTEATAYMYYIVGNFALDTDYKEAARNFYKVSQIDSKFKTFSFPYYAIANFYEKEYAKLGTELKTAYDAKTIGDADFETGKGKLDKLLANMLDAYARAIKYGEAEKNPSVADWKTRFTTVYTFAKKSDAGLNEYLASQPNTALPDPLAAL